MLDSLSKTMSRSSGLVANLKEKASTTISSSSSLTTTNTGSSSLSHSSHLKTFVVIFLDETSHHFLLDKKAKGGHLLDLVFDHLDIREREYFGLMFNDTGDRHIPEGHAPDVMRWLDPVKPLRKQMTRAFSFTGGSSGSIKKLSGSAGAMLNNQHRHQPTLFFRVKFYITGNVKIRKKIFYLFFMTFR